jgi:hypothetical protein
MDLLSPLIDLKRNAMINYNKNPTQSTKDILQQARSKVQKESRKCANEYWVNLCSSIQQAAEIGDARLMYENIKTAIGPKINKIAPLKSKLGEPITDKNTQLTRWVEHYSSLYQVE